jgi:rRNA small subunit aminocarboxypropyltransferase
MQDSNSAQLYCLHLNQCDEKKCTSLKLARKKLITLKKKMNLCPKRAIILDPFAKKIISREDYALIKKFGLLVIDCSWQQTETIFKKPFNTGRALPNLIAVNPVNYGKWNKLSSVEALAAALFLTGFEDQARNILSKFNWSSQFEKLNYEILNLKKAESD